MKPSSQDLALIAALLHDVRYNHENEAYLQNFAQWILTFNEQKKVKNKQPFYYLIRLAREYSEHENTLALARCLSKLGHSGLRDRKEVIKSITNGPINSY